MISITACTAIVLYEKGVKDENYKPFRSVTHWLAAGIGVAVGAYAACVATTWKSYGKPRRRRPESEDGDFLLDSFMPEYEVLEFHTKRVAAPAETAFAAACSMNIQRSGIVRAIFRTRELTMGSRSDVKSLSLGLLEQAKTWGWGLLAEIPGHEIVFGAVTQPWIPNPRFQALSPEMFREFNEPGFVKIAWTIRADTLNAAKSLISTETRVLTTDPVSRAKFRRYWSLVMPGSVLIRRMALRLVKAEAERRARVGIS